LLIALAASPAALGQSAVAPAPLLPLDLEGDPARGAALALTCQGCHAIEGYRNAYPSYHVPRLGGQNADYIEVALLGYRRGSRDHATMQAQARTLSDQDIADVAAYFASLEGAPQTGKSAASAPQVEAGRRKAMTCVQCHGEDGSAQAAQWPHLAGQHASYLERSMRQYQTGERQDVIMAPLVAELDAATMTELAAYFAAQQRLFTAEERRR
jgi:cytochrome c553